MEIIICRKEIQYLMNYRKKRNKEQDREEYNLCPKCKGCCNEGTCDEFLHCHKCMECDKFEHCKYIN
jgi:hypothetical protein